MPATVVAQECLDVLHEENFDAFVAGKDLLPQQLCWPDCPPGSSWQAWDNGGDPFDAAIVTDLVSNSPPNALRIMGPEDIVHTYYDLALDFASYEFAVDVYVPGDFEGESYVTLLGQYRANGPKTWMTQVHWSDTGYVISDFNDVEQNEVPIRFDTWVTFRMVLDLALQRQRIYYGDRFMVETSTCWGPTCDPTLLDAMDFFGNDATPVYYDNLRLCEVPTRCVEDLDWDWEVGFSDLLAVLARWGSCADCPEDLDDSGSVDFGDLLIVLAAWGPCE